MRKGKINRWLLPKSYLKDTYRMIPVCAAGCSRGAVVCSTRTWRSNLVSKSLLKVLKGQLSRRAGSVYFPLHTDERCGQTRSPFHWYCLSGWWVSSLSEGGEVPTCINSRSRSRNWMCDARGHVGGWSISVGPTARWTAVGPFQATALKVLYSDTKYPPSQFCNPASLQAGSIQISKDVIHNGRNSSPELFLHCSIGLRIEQLLERQEKNVIMIFKHPCFSLWEQGSKNEQIKIGIIQTMQLIKWN